MNDYEIRFDSVLQRVEKTRIEVNEHQIIKIVAVSKYSNADEIKALYNIGQRAFGENRVQDLKQKVNMLEDLPLEWHFIGRLQKNKINHLLDLSPTLIQSIDNLELAKEINKRVKNNTPINALLQINSAKEDSKAGVMPELATDIYRQINQECPNITLKGVMSIGAHTDDKKMIQKSFDLTYKIFEELKNDGAIICSMGMSSDFELAIKCGSNMIRIGSLLFK